MNLSRLLYSPTFSQNFTVHRKTGAWTSGRFKQTETDVTMQGIVAPCNPKELNQMPEGDRVTGVMCFHSEQQIYVTHNDSQAGTSDEIEWQSERYRISSVIPWNDFWGWKAFGVRMVSD